MTVEDPIEYLHRDHQSIVNQREVAVDTQSFSHALRSALRQDPDVILVGEMRDFETVETALLAAETGHLVFSTLHTLDATETINRIIAVFPPHQQRQVRIQLAAVLKAAISQRLLPRADGAGPRRRRSRSWSRPRFIRDCIVDKDKTSMIHGAIAAGHLAVRHADLRPVDLRPLPAGIRDARRGAALGLERRRVQAEGPGHLDDDRHGARRDGQASGHGRRRHAGDHPLRWIGRARTPKGSSCWRAASSRSKGCRARLEDRGYSPDDIAEALARLLESGALDDRRVARAYARTAAHVKGRGRLRINQELLHMGIQKDLAAEALGEVFGELDERALIDAAIRKKLRGRPAPGDQGEQVRLYQFLMRQGFSPAGVSSALRKFRTGRRDDQD